MLAFLTGGAVKWWLLGGIVLAVTGYVGTTQLVLHNRQKALDAAVETATKLAADKQRLQDQVDDLAGINDDNLQTLDELRADHERDLGDLQAELARRKKAGMRLTVVRMENARDPDAARPLADACPMLDRFLERVRAEGGAGNPDRDADRAGGIAPAGGAAGLQGRTPAATAGKDGATGARLVKRTARSPG